MKKNIRIFDLKFDRKYRKKFHIGVEKILDEGFFVKSLLCEKARGNFYN